MAGSFTFHNKLHRASHHTLTGTGVPDAGLDPIASMEEPFMGTFYTILPDLSGNLVITSNSFDWWSTWYTVNALSGNWAPTLSLYTTINSLSNNWNFGYSGYLNYSNLSGLYVSVYTTVRTYSGEWNSPFIMYTNRAQQYTRSKTFSGTDLTITTAPSTVSWDLDYNQVTFITLTGDVRFLNPTNRRKGGTYILSIKQDVSGNHDIAFDSAYRFNGTIDLTGVINLSAGGRTVISFVSDGLLLYGDRVFYSE